MAKQRSKAFAGQYDDEEVLMVFRKHPVVMRKGLIMFMFAMLLGVLPSFPYPSEAVLFGGLAAGALLGLIAALPSWVYWYFSVYIVTNQRFIQITQKGFFHKKVVDLALNQIQMVNYEIAGVQETLLGFGTMSVQTQVGDLVIHNVHKPSEVQHELLQLLRERGIATHTDELEANEVGDTNDTDEQEKTS